MKISKHKKTTTPHVLVLGATGMLGRVVYGYLNKKTDTVWGTSRKRDKYLFFDALESEKSFKAIFKKLHSVDYVINCIGLLQSYHTKGQEPSKIDYIQVNSLLPLRLNQLASEYHFKLIHVSTNAVFAMNAKVDESTEPAPESVYGMSKLLGEPEGSNCLTVRSSFIGLDPHEKKGLMELVFKGGEVAGFTNQMFSGCTTLQFSRFVGDIISKRKFVGLRKLSSVIHFVPLGPISKYKLLLEVSKLTSKKVVVAPKKSPTPVSQLFSSKFDKELRMSQYAQLPKTALLETVVFEEEMKI